MIKDRGNIKWSSLMLSEHRKELEKLYELDKSSFNKPFLDEQKLEEMNKVLEQAIHEKASLRIKYYNKGLYEYFGIVEKYNYQTREVYLVNDKDKYKLKINNIVELSL
ncbi:YolD-like family protein [Natronospora cellulosivora (SeqCode)]